MGTCLHVQFLGILRINIGSSASEWDKSFVHWGTSPVCA